MKAIRRIALVALVALVALPASLGCATPSSLATATTTARATTTTTSATRLVHLWREGSDGGRPRCLEIASGLNVFLHYVVVMSGSHMLFDGAFGPWSMESLDNQRALFRAAVRFVVDAPLPPAALPPAALPLPPAALSAGQ